MFQEIYYHPLHNPGLFWAAGLPLLVFFATRRSRATRANADARFLSVFALAFQLEILLDAALQGELTPLGGPLKVGVSVLLVILGDLRFFLLLERLGRVPPRSFLVPAGLSLLVPAAAFGVRPLVPEGPRSLFLTYELMFVAVAIAVLFVIPRRGLPPARARWLKWLAGYELVQYALWATADVVILAGHDLGFLLRLVPNTMYYAGFVPFAWFTAPSELRP